MEKRIFALICVMALVFAGFSVPVIGVTLDKNIEKKSDLVLYKEYFKKNSKVGSLLLKLSDSEPPELSLDIGEPKDQNYYYLDEKFYTGIGSNTPIIISSDGDIGGSGLDHIGIEVFVAESYGEWESIYSLNVKDGDREDKTPANDDKICVELYMNKSCWHQIHYYAVDNAGNRNPDDGSMFHTIEFIVDADSPNWEHWYQGPQYYNTITWIKSETEKYVKFYDTGFFSDGSGVEKVDWEIYKKEGDELLLTDEGIVEDNKKGDLDLEDNKIKIRLNVSESCEHFICHQAQDNLGNTGKKIKQYVKVDNNSPFSHVEVKKPSCKYFKDEEMIYYLRSNTPVEIFTVDLLSPCAVGVDYFEYNIFKYGELETYKKIYDKTEERFTFDSEGNFTLKYRAVDLLGNIEDWKFQNFTVDDEAPIIVKKIGTPNVTGSPSDPSEPDYYITSDTAITIDALTDKENPFFNIKYRLNDDNWIDITESVPKTITLPNECKYVLEISATDGNNHAIDIGRFYVDNSAPVFNIIKPYDDVYYPGQCIQTEIYAEDKPNFASPCFDDHFVGIGEGSEGEAWIIDILPHLLVTKLETEDLTYETSQLNYGHKACIPIDICINDGPVLFVGGAKDRLDNGASRIKDMVVDFYYQAGGHHNFDMEDFNSLIEPLIENKHIVWVGFTTDIPNEDYPSVVIEHPISENTESGVVDIKIKASDRQTNINNLDVKVAVYVSNYPAMTFDAILDGSFFKVDFDISGFTDGKKIQLVAYATDEDGNTGVSPPVEIFVDSDVIFDKYMEIGWNPVVFEFSIDDNSVESVFSSIMDDIEIIFEESSWKNYIPNDSGNTILEIDTTKTYWVKLKDSNQFYLT